jgi:hypothetical protein
VCRLKEEAPISLYPYLEIDAHLSPIGHQLVADEILAYLRQT